MATTLFHANQYVSTVLATAGGIDDSQTTDIELQSVTGIDTTKPGVACVSYSDPIDTDNAEWIPYTSINSSTKKLEGVTRGAEGFSAKSHAYGVTVAFPLSESHINNLATALSIGGVATNGVTSTIDDDTMATASATTLATSESIKAYADTYGNNSSIHRQAIINGNFDVWQRGTSFAKTSGAGTYSADRWVAQTIGPSCTYSRQSVTDLYGSRYCMRVQRNSGQTSTSDVYLRHSLETNVSYPFRGKKVTLSFYAKAGADYSATSNNLNIRIYSGTGTDQGIQETYTGSTTLINENKELTTSWQKFEVTTDTIADTVNELAFDFIFMPSGTAGTNDYYEVAQLQLCAGDTALPFMPKSYGEELRACQRYYVQDGGERAYFGNASVVSGDVVSAPVFLPVNMRIQPTIVVTETAVGSFPASSETIQQGGVRSFFVQKTANATSQNGFFRGSYTASAEL